MDARGIHKNLVGVGAADDQECPRRDQDTTDTCVGSGKRGNGGGRQITNSKGDMHWMRRDASENATQTLEGQNAHEN